MCPIYYSISQLDEDERKLDTELMILGLQYGRKITSKKLRKKRHLIACKIDQLYGGCGGLEPEGRILPVRVRSRARTVRRHGRHVSRSSFAVAADSGGGGDDGGDGQSDSDCNRAFVLWGKGELCVVSARLGGLSLNDRINGIIVSRYRALPAQARGAQGDGRFFVPFGRWAA